MFDVHLGWILHAKFSGKKETQRTEMKETKKAKKKNKQDGPSLESSSYLNVSLRYLGP